MTPRLILSDLVSHLLNEVGRDSTVVPKNERLGHARDTWRSLLFCILSSQVRVVVANRAVETIISAVPFFTESLAVSEVYQYTKRILRDDVGYRFYDVKAKQVADSWFAFAQLGEDLYAYLDSFDSEEEAREAVARLFPGLGMKQASMFLRDVGFSSRLCIIDTHVLWYCSQILAELPKTLSPKRYLELESFLLGESDKWGVAPNVFDSVVWAAARAFKARQCTMQFV